jgi:hypothetical protein
MGNDSVMSGRFWRNGCRRPWRGRCKGWSRVCGTECGRRGGKGLKRRRIKEGLRVGGTNGRGWIGGFEGKNRFIKYDVARYVDAAHK